MTALGARAMLPLGDSPWRPLYEEAARLIRGHTEVVDLGCGTGRFLEQLRRQKHHAPITGVDFSPAALAETRRYVRYEGLRLECVDLADWQPSPKRAGNTTYVCLEVLEHLEDDVGLVQKIPPAHRLVFSVPNFESALHVRHFRGPADIWRRYESLLLFRRWVLLEHGQKATHLCEAIRRTDAWA